MTAPVAPPTAVEPFVGPQAFQPDDDWRFFGYPIADDALELYNVEGWGIGYFGVNQKGHVTVHPTKSDTKGLDLFELAMDLEAQGIAGAEVEGWLGRLELAEGGRGLLQPGIGRPHVRLDGTPRAGAYLSADHWNAAGGRCP